MPEIRLTRLDGMDGDEIEMAWEFSQEFLNSQEFSKLWV
jgi:hypothetical protein